MIHFSACCVFFLVSTAEAKPNKKTKTGGKPNITSLSNQNKLSQPASSFLYLLLLFFCILLSVVFVSSQLRVSLRPRFNNASADFFLLSFFIFIDFFIFKENCHQLRVT